MEDPPSHAGHGPAELPSSSGDSTGWVAPSVPPVSGRPDPSSVHDHLADSFALDDAVGNPPGPAVRPSTPGGPARHASGTAAADAAAAPSPARRLTRLGRRSPRPTPR